MSAGPLVVEIICTCCLAAFLLHRYGDLRKQNILTTLTTFIAWYFSFLIVFVLPLDVSSVSILCYLLKDLFINLKFKSSESGHTACNDKKKFTLLNCFWQTFFRQCLHDKAPKILTTTPSPPTTTSGSFNTTNASDIRTSQGPVTPSTPTVGGQNQVPVSSCEIPLSHVPENVLPTLWQVVYWTSQLLTW